MKLTLVHPEFKVAGGAEILVASHAQFYRDQGFDTRAATFGYDGKRWDDWFDRIPVAVMPPPKGADAVRDFLRTRIPRRVEWLERQLDEDAVVIGYNYPASTVLGYAKTRARRIWHCCEPPRMLHLFETNPTAAARARATLGVAKERATRVFFRRMIEWRAKSAFGVIMRRNREIEKAAIANYRELWAISDFSRDCLTAVYGRRDVEVVYPMVRFPNAGPARSGLRRDRLGVLCHSRLETLKNVDTVLRGFQRFHASPAGRNAHLHVVGQGDMRPRLERLAARLGIAPSTTFHGFLSLPDLERVYASCDVYALLPIDEPFGMVYPEAAARGLLTIGPDHGGPLEILDHGKYGWNVSAFDPEVLADALTQITRLTDAEVDRRRIEADRAHRARFSREPIGKRLLQLLAKG